MQTAKQLSVSLVNKPGRLADMLAALNKGKVSFRALAVMDSGERGTVRFVPDDVAAATSRLGEDQRPLRCRRRAVGRDSQSVGRIPQDLRDSSPPNTSTSTTPIARSTAAERPKGGVLAVIKVNDLAKAQRVLSENGTATERRLLPPPGSDAVGRKGEG